MENGSFIGINLSLSDIASNQDRMILEERKNEKKDDNISENALKNKSGE
jgi:hypothetical protein